LKVFEKTWKNRITWGKIYIFTSTMFFALSDIFQTCVQSMLQIFWLAGFRVVSLVGSLFIDQFVFELGCSLWYFRRIQKWRKISKIGEMSVKKTKKDSSFIDNPPFFPFFDHFKIRQKYHTKPLNTIYLRKNSRKLEKNWSLRIFREKWSIFCSFLGFLGKYIIWIADEDKKKILFQVVKH
jgi:hypothetical protein